MKFKPIYIYLIIILAIILYFVFAPGSEENQVQKEIAGKEMPQDDVHKNLDPNLIDQPSKSNVKQDVIERMNKLKEEIAANPGDTAKIKEYARFLLSAHKLDNAAELYNQILSVNPNRTDILLELTFVYFRKQDLIKADELTNRVLQIDPDNQEANYNSAAIAAERGDTEKAKRLWNELIKKYPDSKAAELAQKEVEKLK